MPKYRKLVTFDWAMKKLLRNRANFVVLEGFLSELLRTDITIINIEDSESEKETASDKYNRVDMLVRDASDQLILVELQYDSETDYFHRMLYGVSKLITSHIKGGESYENVKKVISVNLVYFDLGHGKDYVYYGRTDFTGIHFMDHLQLTEKQKQHFQADTVQDIYPEYYILKINKFDDYAKDTLDEWIYFLKNEDLPADSKAKGLKEAAEALSIMKMSDEERAAYERYEDNKHLQASMITSTMQRAEKAEAELERTEAKLQDKNSELQKRDSELQEKDAELAQKDSEKQQVIETAINQLVKSGLSEEQAKKALGL